MYRCGYTGSNVEFENLWTAESDRYHDSFQSTDSNEVFNVSQAKLVFPEAYLQLVMHYSAI